ERRDVLAARAERRERDLDDREAVVEVLAERAFVHASRERTVRRREDAHVDRLLKVTSEAANGARLDRAQELRLDVERQLADLVEEDRAAVRLFEDASTIHLRAAERAAHVAE